MFMHFWMHIYYKTIHKITIYRLFLNFVKAQKNTRIITNLGVSFIGHTKSQYIVLLIYVAIVYQLIAV